MRLLLIRHGQTPSNVIGALDTGRPGAGLTALGQIQAQAIPDALRDEEIEAVYASPLLRTQLTAAPLAAARGLEVQVREGFEEVVAGDYEMRTDRDAVRAYIESLRCWSRGELGFALAGGESGENFFTRFDTAIAGVAEKHQAAVVVSHGAAIRSWATSRAANVVTEKVSEFHLLNTGMCVLEGDPDSGWMLQRWHSDPIGGAEVIDESAHDVTGEPDEAAAVIDSDTGTPKVRPADGTDLRS